MGRKLLYFILLFVHLENYKSFGEDCRRCRGGRTHTLKSYDCYDKDFRVFPNCIPSDVEVLELTTNRIRKVNRSELSQFSHLKFLYLRDNLLATLQNDTFEDMDSLHALDLSQNNIKTVPTSVFKLSSLKNLYLSQNLELNLAGSLENAKPILSPLEALDISCTTDEFSVAEFPDFGPMPYLTLLNITENQYRVLTPKHFAGLCNLRILININVSNNYENGCDCWIINRWLLERKVQFNTFVCPVTESECLDQEPNEEDAAIHNKCLEVIKAIKSEIRLKKILIGVGVSVLIIVVVVFFVYFCFIRNKRNSENVLREGRGNSLLEIQPDGGALLANNPTKTSVPNL